MFKCELLQVLKRIRVKYKDNEELENNGGFARFSTCNWDKIEFVFEFVTQHVP